MSAQTDQIKNTYYLRVSLIAHLFTHVIPLPLPHNHAKKAQCLYEQPIPYFLQIDIM